MNTTDSSAPLSSCQNAEPDMAQWLTEAKQDPHAPYVGMYLTHNGIVRATPKRVVRPEQFPTSTNASGTAPVPSLENKVVAVDFSYDKQKLDAIVEEARSWEGVYYVRVWLNEGKIPVGGSLMYVLIGADIRPHAIDALNELVGYIKNEAVNETEIYAS